MHFMLGLPSIREEIFMYRRLALLLCTGLLLCATATAVPAYATSTSESRAITSQSTSKATKNKKAHTAYYKRLKKLEKDGLFLSSIGGYQFVDLTGDGIDEMIVSWWPSVYTYKGGKAMRVDNADVGSSYYVKLYPSRKVFVRTMPDHMGSASKNYYKWNGKKFVKVASTYQPSQSGKKQGAKPFYWVKGKGKVSKSMGKAYVKKITKGSKGQAPVFTKYY